jgi:hypothetical protein
MLSEEFHYSYAEMKNLKQRPGYVAVIVVVLIILLLIPCVWFIVLFGYGNYKNWGHQQFAAQSQALIPPAREMGETFVDCRHYIVYGKYAGEDTPLFNTTAYFGDRYELTMQVPVQIDSPTAGHMTGIPTFSLQEVGSISIDDGQVSTSFSRSMEFGPAEWVKLYQAKGDLKAIGFTVNPLPVPNFQKKREASRPTN